MKSIVKWILFVPVCLLSSLLMLFVGISGDSGSFLGFNMNSASEVVIYLTLGLLAALFILSFFDRTTSPVHLLKKNYFCSVTAIASAFLLAATAALDFTSMFRDASYGVADVLTSVFSIIAAVALLFVGMNHFSGTNTPRMISIVYLTIPVWCSVHLIARFLDHTAEPVAAAETMDLLFFVALALFSLYAMMIHAIIPGKNAVKSSMFIGFPAVSIAFAYSVYLTTQIVRNNGSDFLSYIPAATYFCLGLYILGFVSELSFNAKTTEEQILLEAETESPEETAEDTPAVQEQAEDEAEIPCDAKKTAETEEDTAEPDVECDAAEVTEFSEEPLVPRVAEDEGEEIVADELYRAAKISDSKSKPVNDNRSEDNMIIEGEKSVPAVQKAPVDKPIKGATSRESIMIEDDFILSIDNSDAVVSRTVDADEDISAFILEKSEQADDQEAARKKYESRLDEIDRLIISIQGGDGPKSDSDNI